MKLDITSLASAIVSLEESIGVVSDESWFNSQPKAVQNTLIAGVIKNFEFVYELSIKMVRRRIEMDSASPTEADFSDFRDLLRTAAEKGLVADVEAWFDYRTMRNLTSHTYDHEKARKVYQGTLKFIGDAKALLHALTARNA
ncbi:MAG: nucleotidyltransferase substrate binding protein [Pseudomonadota bacterium]